MVTSSSASLYGQAMSFTALVSPAPSAPTGAVVFFIDGAPAGSVSVDPTTGMATFTTASLGVGNHSLTAAYTGNTNFLPGQSGMIQQSVSQAGSRSVASATAVRNRRGRLTAVSLGASILPNWPAGGTPTGTVVFYVGATRLKTATLSNGTASVNVKPGRVLNKSVKVQYNGDTNFGSSVSPKVKVTRKSIASVLVARPFFRVTHRTR